MMIGGFQPLTLLDYPGVISCIVFTQGCPFRCPYCHNPDLIPLKAEKRVHETHVFSHMDRHRAMLEGVCVTGGEPTIQPDLPVFLARIKQRGLLVKLDTNGLHPRMIQSLITKKLVDYFAMDIKHIWKKYHTIVGHVPDAVVDQCRATQDLIRASGIAHEFRTTVDGGLHTTEDLIEIADALGFGETYALQPVRYETTLNADLPHAAPLNLTGVAEQIRAQRPDLILEIRQ